MLLALISSCLAVTDGEVDDEGVQIRFVKLPETLSANEVRNREALNGK